MHTSSTSLFAAALLIFGPQCERIEASQPVETGGVRAIAREPGEGGLDLESAVTRALRSNPSLAAGTNAVSAAEARVTQAGLLPNPALRLESENFGGSGEYAGFGVAENTVVVGQPVPLGGRVGRRRAVAESGRALAARDLEAIRLDVIAGTSSAFYRVLAAQQRAALAGELVDLAQQFADTVGKRVDAGKVSPIEATRASIEVAEARVGLARAEREQAAARALLAASWGSSVVDFDRAVGELPPPREPPPLAELRESLRVAPEVRRLDDLVERGRRSLELERSLRFPDLELGIGPRFFEETDGWAWVAGLSVPLPVFDRNQGGIRAAEYELESLRRDADAARIGFEAEVAAAYERLRALSHEATVLGREVVPAAEEAFRATETGYREGKLGFLEVLDAQRTLFRVRSSLLDSREEYAIARVELERRVGLPALQSAAAMPVAAESKQGGTR